MSEAHSELCRFIRTHREDILASWERQIRALPVARGLSRPRLLDHLPDLLDSISRMVCSARHEAQVIEGAHEHAVHRLDSGFDVGVVASEYALLRDCILKLYEVRGAPAVPVAEVQRFNLAIDDALVVSMERYAKARERTLSGLDRISQAALQSVDVDDFLPRLLRVLLETTESVDSVGIFLRQGDRLHLRAAVGILETELARAFSIAVGEGLTGTVAADCEARETRSAEEDPQVLVPILKEAGARAVYVVPMVEGGHVLGVSHMVSRTASQFSEEDKLFFRAMTHRATALVVQAQLAERLRESELRARELLEFEQRLIGIVSHDLRNPLAGILTSASLLLRMGGLDDRQARALARIVSSAQRGGRLIGDLLDFTQARLGGGIPVRPGPADLHEIARRVSEEVQLNHPERELRVEQEGEGTGEWDGDRVAQVVANLLSNAIAYGAPGTPVRLSTRGEADRVRLTVHNQGPPIPAEVLPALFEPMKRGPPAQSGSAGIGLGLYIVHKVVEAHGGNVEVTSTARDGTTFAVLLPRRPPPQATAG
jgi:signal transduction histidine kinase